MAIDFEAVRAASVAEAAATGLSISPSLPLLGAEDVAHPRPVSTVVARTRALYGVLALREGTPLEAVLEVLRRESLLDSLSESERRYLEALESGRSEEAARIEIPLSWRTEAEYALGWALGLFDALPVTGLAGEIAPAFAPIDPDATRGGPDPALDLRPVDELVGRLDAFYCVHWAATDHALTASRASWPAAVVPGAVMERRHALEWIFTDEDWDEVDLST
ncbi:MAG: DUF4272 domain-containing protein [Chloroflexota bacterium]|nr:DUF4272 domain-containing protein [Chloroflexota bacterium]